MILLLLSSSPPLSPLSLYAFLPKALCDLFSVSPYLFPLSSLTLTLTLYPLSFSFPRAVRLRQLRRIVRGPRHGPHPPWRWQREKKKKVATKLYLVETDPSTKARPPNLPPNPAPVIIGRSSMIAPWMPNSPPLVATPYCRPWTCNCHCHRLGMTSRP